MKTHRFFDNVGGLNLRFNDILLDERDAEEIVNLHATTRGSWTNDGIGFQTLNDAGLGGQVTGMDEYTTLEGHAYLMVSANGKLHTFAPATGTATEIADGLDADAPMRFVTFNGLLICCNGVNAPKKWDGTTFAELGGWPPAIPGVSPGQPSLAAIFANRVVFSGDADNPSMLYLSELENPENFTPDTGATSAGAIQVSPGDGDRITALQTLYLPLANEEVLVVFKQHSTYLLTGNDAENFVLQKVSDEFGAVSSQSLALVGNELMFLSAEGITSLSTATAQGNITTGFISDRIRPQLSRLNRHNLGQSFAVHLRGRQEVWWFVTEGSATQNQRVLVYNYGINRAWSRRTGIVAACGCMFGGELYTGNYTGYIQQQLRGNTYDDEPILWTYRTPFYNLGAPRQRKRIRDVELYFKQIASLSLTLWSAWDFRRAAASRQSRNLTLSPDSNSSLFGTGVYGVDYYAQSGSSIVRFTPSGSGQFFQLEFTGSSDNSPVEIEGWSITAIYGGIR